MHNKIKGNFFAKTLAWIGITFSGVIFVGSILGAYLLWESDIYDMTEKEAWELAAEDVSHQYTIMALADLAEPSNDKFADTYFRYGIIEGETLRGRDLNSDSTYVERNFTAEVTEDDLYWRHFYVGENTTFRYTPSKGIFGEYGMETEQESVTDSTEYYGRDTGDTGNEKTNAYMVVCQLPEMWEVTGKFGDGDLFVQARILVSLLFHLRYSIYVIMFVFLAIFVFCFVFLIAAAGHRKGRTEIVEAGLDLLPLEICLGVVFFLEGIIVWIVDGCSYRLPEVPFLVMFVFGLLCMFWLALAATLSVAVRIKCRRFWKNTVIYRVLALAGRLLRGIAESLPMLWKAIGQMAIVFGVEFINILFMITRGSSTAFMFWFLEKSVLVLLVCWCIRQMWQLQKGGQRIAEGDLSHQVDTGKLYGEFKKHGDNLNSISSGMSRAVDERLKSERFRTELITNVSHDIKTPLTSIINYVDLLEKEDLQNEAAIEYLEVLDRQSNRLKKLIEDLMEASKASTGNLAVNLERLEVGVFLVQTVGEYEEKTIAKDLELLIRKPEEPVYIMADGRHFWRVIDNLMNNICKYAQPGTRVYINLEVRGEKTYLIFRNTSKYPLNISSEELMERFVRGDSSRNTEGNGLGLSIASSLMELMGGSFTLHVDGDLFKVEIGFDTLPE